MSHSSTKSSGSRCARSGRGSRDTPGRYRQGQRNCGGEATGVIHVSWAPIVIRVSARPAMRWFSVPWHQCPRVRSRRPSIRRAGLPRWCCRRPASFFALVRPTAGRPRRVEGGLAGFEQGLLHGPPRGKRASSARIRSSRARRPVGRETPVPGGAATTIRPSFVATSTSRSPTPCTTARSSEPSRFGVGSPAPGRGEGDLVRLARPSPNGCAPRPLTPFWPKATTANQD
jgi:hypothetical protein